MKRIEDILKEKLAGGQSAGAPGQDASLWASVQSNLSAAAPPAAQPLAPAARGLSAVGRGGLFAGGLVLGVALGVTMGLHYGQLAEEAPGQVDQLPTAAPVIQASQHDAPPILRLPEVAPFDETFVAEEPPAHVADAIGPPAESRSSFVRNEDVPGWLPMAGADAPPTLFLLKRREIPSENGPTRRLLAATAKGLQDHEFFAVRMHGGAVWSAFAYDNPELTPMNASLFGDWGSAAGVAVDLDLFGQSWSIGLGAQHLVQRLAFDRTWTESDTDSNGVVSTTTYRRQVRRYNHLKTVLIPLEWRKEMVRPRWTFGGALGAQLVLRTSARGHAFLADGEVMRYGDGDLPRLRLNWAPTARLYAGHHFAPEWRVDVSLGASVQGFRSAGLERLDNPDLTPWQGQLWSCSAQVGLTRFIRR
jgi:hypothetical protein